MEELNQFMKQYIDINKSIKELEANKEKLKSQIMILIKTNDITDYRDELGNSLSYSSYNRTTFDKEKIEKFCDDTGQEISYFQKMTEVTSLKITDRGGKDEE